MADYTKVHTNLIVHQAITHPGVIKGSAVDVKDALEMGVYIHHASVETNTPTAGELPEFHLEANPFASGDEGWDVLPGGKYTFSGTAPLSEALTATEPVAETVMAVASTADFALNERVYIKDATVVDGEWHRINTLVASTSYTLKDGLLNEKVTETMYNQAEQFYASYSLGGIARVRGWYMNRPVTGNNTILRVDLIITTEIV